MFKNVYMCLKKKGHKTKEVGQKEVRNDDQRSKKLYRHHEGCLKRIISAQKKWILLTKNYFRKTK